MLNTMTDGLVKTRLLEFKNEYENMGMQVYVQSVHINEASDNPSL